MRLRISGSGSEARVAGAGAARRGVVIQNSGLDISVEVENNDSSKRCRLKYNHWEGFLK